MENKELQLCTNETILQLIDVLKKRLRTSERIVVIVIIIMLLQTSFMVGGIFYFLNNFDVSMTETSVTQEITGDNTSNNYIDGNSNTVKIAEGE